MVEQHQYCTFYLDGHYFGLDVLKVQEIIRYQEMTRVPLASPTVRGLINLSGQIVTAIDLRRRLAGNSPDVPLDRRPTPVADIGVGAVPARDSCVLGGRERVEQQHCSTCRTRRRGRAECSTRNSKRPGP